LGSGNNDILAGDDFANVIEGGGGNDIIDGAGNVDGLDLASYQGAGSGVAVDLNQTGSQDTLGAGRDILLNIEGVVGSGYNDSLVGDASGNYLDGGAGDDLLDGGAGDDILHAESGHDTVLAGSGDDTIHLSADAGQQPVAVDGGSEVSTGDTVVLHDLAVSYDLSSLAAVAADVERLDISGDGTSTSLTLSCQDIHDLVGDGNMSELTVLADSGDSLVLDSGSLAPGFSPGATQDYSVTDGAQTAIVHWIIA
ncbi:MAG: hypothetical protein D6751_02670, partial [Deltaproteobacteria bacterium]